MKSQLMKMIRETAPFDEPSKTRLLEKVNVVIKWIGKYTRTGWKDVMI
jgi:hypothetical protein